ncbi:sensor histidine kinase [Frondihabitans australicus]|uniref:histidine kinase n=1 Tax=Frondihabitans australicus TaxID=386892 RepID=A0A495IH69_9MICO|nr:histidine kinase [Frondihabitans australicus]RKR75109.1 signal transduction histidine kinase [Frondihabitans australicus]
MSAPRRVEHGLLIGIVAIAVVVVGLVMMELYRTAIPLSPPALVGAQALGIVAAVAVAFRTRFHRLCAAVVVVCTAFSPAAVPALWLALYSFGTHQRYRSVIVSCTGGAAALILCTGLYLRADGYGRSTDMIGVFGLFSLVVALGAAVTGAAAGMAAARHEAVVREIVRLDIESASRARLAEREQLSREIHDLLGHRLALLNLFSSALAGDATADAEKRGIVELITTNVQGAASDLAQLLEVLHRSDGPASVGPSPEPLDSLFERFLAAGMDLTVDRGLGADTVTDAYRRTLERFCREGLTNALKYAAPGPVSVEIDSSADGALSARIRSPFHDPSRTEPRGPAPTSSGIAGLEERAALLGGSVWVDLTSSHLDLLLRLPATTRGEERAEDAA